MPWLLLAVLLSLSLGFFLPLRAAEARRDASQMSIRVESAVQKIRNRLDIYAAIGRGMDGFLSSGAEFNPDQLRAYVQHLKIAERLPAVTGIRVLARIDGDSGKPAGWAARLMPPDLVPWPETGLKTKFPVIFIDPYEGANRNSIGYDPLSEPVRAPTFEKAIETGLPALSPPVFVVQGSEPGPVGFILVTPVFDGAPSTPGERRARLIGFASVVISGDTFLEFTAGEPDQPVAIQLYDKSGPDPLTPLGSAYLNGPGFKPRFVEWRSIQMMDRVWTLRFESRPSFEAALGPHISYVALALGMAISALIFYVARRQTALTAELNRSESELRGINENLERIVADRTAEAQARASEARALAKELTWAEQRERERIAELLHDELQQILVSAKMRFTALRGDPLDENVGKLGELIAQAIEATRSVSRELRTGPGEMDLAEAVKSALGKMAADAALDLDLFIDPDLSVLSAGAKLLLLRAARELLFNVVKHAQATRAWVRLTRVGPNLVMLDVADNGVGRPVEEIVQTMRSSRHYGLASIKSQAEAMSGSVRVSAANGGGCRVQLTCPSGDGSDSPWEIAATDSPPGKS